MATPAYVHLCAIVGAILLLTGTRTPQERRAWLAGLLAGLALYGVLMVDQAAAYGGPMIAGAAGLERVGLELWGQWTQQPVGHAVALLTWALAGAGVGHVVGSR